MHSSRSESLGSLAARRHAPHPPVSDPHPDPPAGLPHRDRVDLPRAPASARGAGVRISPLTRAPAWRDSVSATSSEGAGVSWSSEGRPRRRARRLRGRTGRAVRGRSRRPGAASPDRDAGAGSGAQENGPCVWTGSHAAGRRVGSRPGDSDRRDRSGDRNRALDRRRRLEERRVERKRGGGDLQPEGRAHRDPVPRAGRARGGAPAGPARLDPRGLANDDARRAGRSLSTRHVASRGGRRPRTT